MATLPVPSTAALQPPPARATVVAPAGSSARPAGALCHCFPEIVAMLMILSGLGMLALGAASVPECPALRGPLVVEAEARP